MAAFNKIPRRSSLHESSNAHSKVSTDREELELLKPMKGVKLPLLPPRFSLHSLLEASLPAGPQGTENPDNLNPQQL